MKIRHQPPSSDLSWTVQAPLTLETPTGEVVRIEAWSLAGLEWPEDAGACPATGVLSVPFQGVDVRFPVRLKAEEDTSTALFEGLSGRQRETLALFYKSLLSGTMASSEDVITSLDTPVDLVPMEETEEEAAQSKAGKLPAPLRAALHVIVYVCLATLIASILGLSVFNSVTRIDIQHGRVVAPIAERLPASEGFVKSIHVSAGEAVEAGQVLVRLKNPVAEGRLTQARAKLSARQKELLELSQALENLIVNYSEAPPETRGAVVAQVYARFVGDRGFDILWTRWLKLLEDNPEAADEIDPFQFALDRLREVETALLAEVRGLRAARDAQKSALSMSHVRAPSDGVVHEVLVRKGQPLGSDDLAVIFESRDPRVAIGWVSDRFAETIFVGMTAQIGVNVAGEKRTLAGRVSHVRAGNDPRRPGEFGIIVSITPEGLSAAETKEILQTDAPVRLQARRPAAQRMLDWFGTLGAQDG